MGILLSFGGSKPLGSQKLRPGMARPWDQTPSWALKKSPWAPLVRQDPPKIEANLGLKKLFFVAQVGLYFRDVLAALARRRFFFGPHVGPLIRTL